MLFYKRNHQYRLTVEPMLIVSELELTDSSELVEVLEFALGRNSGPYCGDLAKKVAWQACLMVSSILLAHPTRVQRNT